MLKEQTMRIPFALQTIGFLWAGLLTACGGDDDAPASGDHQDAAIVEDASLEDAADAEKVNPLLDSEAYKAFIYLNKVRANPPAYSEACHVDLSDLEPRPLLLWNESLAKAAQAKAEDMRDRNYFAHVDPDGNGMNIKIVEAGYDLPEAWYKDPSANYFESLAAGASSGEAAIQMLIEDRNTDPPGHRNHLLALDEFWSNCSDIGIGYAEGNQDSPFATYVCVLIAKHDF